MRGEKALEECERIHFRGCQQLCVDQAGSCRVLELGAKQAPSMSEQQQLSDVVKSEQLSGGESHFKVHTGILLVTVKLSFNNNCIHRSLEDTNVASSAGTFSC